MRRVLPDPYGLVRSRAFVVPNGSVRLPLNVSESTRTGTGRFVSALAGAGVHHIAFAAADAAGVVDAAAARQAPLLDTRENYYEDLAARFGLDDAELEALRQRYLLYGRDASGGLFRHAYTRQVRDRVFLEVAERSGTYGGFGAMNASGRMATQRRSSTPADWAGILPGQPGKAETERLAASRQKDKQPWLPS